MNEEAVPWYESMYRKARYKNRITNVLSSFR
jgi:hypothetical protein